MAFLRTSARDFVDAVRSASPPVGGLDPAYIEKDYWVTQVLRALHEGYPHGFLFKGGTSLSKGYGIIERFSEDVDILVVKQAGASISEGEKYLAEMTASISKGLDMPWREQRRPSSGRNASRGDYLAYRPQVEPAVAVSASQGVVLLEVGYGEGQEPCEMVAVRTLVGDALGITAEFEDLAPFQLRALEPRRTLIEKLFALHHVASNWDGSETVRRRFGRHYYDVFRLLDHHDTLTKLQRRPEFDQIVTEVERISASHFGGTTPRPAEGFSASPAFRPSDELRPWLEREFMDGLNLIPSGAVRPTFLAVLRRVQQKADLL